MTRFKTLQVTLLVAIAGSVGVFLVLSRSGSVVYPDGLSVKWIGVSVGTNTFVYGTPLEKALNKAKWVPWQSLRFFGNALRRPMFLRPPRDDADLTGWVLLRQPRHYSTNRYNWDGIHVMAANLSGRAIENEPMGPWGGPSADESILCVPLIAFPRNEKTLRLLIQPPPDRQSPGATNRAWAQFQFPNPIPRAAEHWTPVALPATNQFTDLSVTLLSLPSAESPYVHFGVISDVPWQVVEYRITDEEGNSFWYSNLRGLGRLGQEYWLGCRYPLESNRVWKVETTLVQVKRYAFVSDEPMPTNELMEVSVTVDGREARMVDSFGTAYLASATGQSVLVRRETGADRPYLMLAEVTESGRKLKKIGGWWEGGRFAQKKLRWGTSAGSATNLTLRFFAPKVVTTEFYANPTAVEAINREVVSPR